MKKNEVELGSFTVSRDSGAGHDWLKIAAKSGNWNVRIRDDNEMFLLLRRVCNDSGMRDYAESFVQMLYLMGNTLPDLQFMTDFHEAYTGMQKRMAERAETLSGEEDARILEEQRKLHMISETGKGSL